MFVSVGQNTLLRIKICNPWFLFLFQTVITNEHVVAMMNNTLKCAGEVEGELSEAVYEPKMTRSKIKEVLEKSDVSLMCPGWFTKMVDITWFSFDFSIIVL